MAQRLLQQISSTVTKNAQCNAFQFPARWLRCRSPSPQPYFEGPVRNFQTVQNIWEPPAESLVKNAAAVATKGLAEPQLTKIVAEELTSSVAATATSAPITVTAATTTAASPICRDAIAVGGKPAEIMSRYVKHVENTHIRMRSSRTYTTTTIPATADGGGTAPAKSSAEQTGLSELRLNKDVITAIRRSRETAQQTAEAARTDVYALDKVAHKQYKEAQNIQAVAADTQNFCYELSGSQPQVRKALLEDATAQRNRQLNFSDYLANLQPARMAGFGCSNVATVQPEWRIRDRPPMSRPPRDKRTVRKNSKQRGNTADSGKRSYNTAELRHKSRQPPLSPLCGDKSAEDTINEPTNLFALVKALHPPAQFNVPDPYDAPVEVKEGPRIDQQTGGHISRTPSEVLAATTKPKIKFQKMTVPYPSLADITRTMQKKKLSTSVVIPDNSINTIKAVKLPFKAINDQIRKYSTRVPRGFCAGVEGTKMVKLKRLQPIWIQEKPKYCAPKPCVRADQGMRICPKQLPRLQVGNCECFETQLPLDVSPLERLNMPKFLDKPRECAPDPCPPRADDGLTVQKRCLRKYVPGTCRCIETPPTEAPLLKPLNIKFPDPARICHCSPEPCCSAIRADYGLTVECRSLPTLKAKDCPQFYPTIPIDVPLVKLKRKLICEPKRKCPPEPCKEPRADDNLCPMKKRLKPFTPMECPCIERPPHLTSPPLHRLKKFRLPDPARICVDNLCPARADQGMCLECKVLPVLQKSSCPCIEARTPCLDVPMKRLKFKPQDPVRKCPKVVCTRADDGMCVKKKCLKPITLGNCPSIEPQFTDVPPLNRLDLFMPDPARSCPCANKECCPIRADLGLVPHMKRLPILKPSDCPCIPEPCLIDVPPLRRLTPRLVPEPKRCCKDETCDDAERADDNYCLQKRCLKPLLGPTCPVIEESPKLTMPIMRRLKKIFIPERTYCPVEMCPPRADACLKVTPKVLPKMPLDKCPCVEDPPLKRGKPIKRLVPRQIRTKCRECVEQKCPDRADACYKAPNRKLRPIPTGCYIPPNPCLKESEPLPRLPFKVTESPRFCYFEDCPPRADVGMSVEPRVLPTLKPQEKCCLLKPDVLKEGRPLVPLRARSVPTPRQKSCPEDICSERADCSYRVQRRSLPTLILSEKYNCISAQEYNSKRCYSTTCTLRPSTAGNNMLINTNNVCSLLARNYAKGPPIPPEGLKFVPLCRPVKRKGHDDQKDARIRNTMCGVTQCTGIPRMDDVMKYNVPRKKLPELKMSACPCKEPPEPMKILPLRGPVKRLQYDDEPRKCAVDPCTIKSNRADFISNYDVKPKKLPKLPNKRQKRYYTVTSSPLNFSRRLFHTSTARDGCRPKPKPSCSNIPVENCVVESLCSTRAPHCVDIKLCGCPPKVCRNPQYPVCIPYVPKPCCKQNSPYPAFSECSAPGHIPSPCECEPPMKYLQPKHPILHHVRFSEPPPRFEHIDPQREEDCVREMRGLINHGHTRICEDLSKPVRPLRVKTAKEQLCIRGVKRRCCDNYNHRLSRAMWCHADCCGRKPDGGMTNNKMDRYNLLKAMEQKCTTGSCWRPFPCPCAPGVVDAVKGLCSGREKLFPFPTTCRPGPGPPQSQRARPCGSGIYYELKGLTLKEKCPKCNVMSKCPAPCPEPQQNMSCICQPPPAAKKEKPCRPCNRNKICNNADANDTQVAKVLAELSTMDHTMWERISEFFRTKPSPPIPMIRNQQKRVAYVKAKKYASECDMELRCKPRCGPKRHDSCPRPTCCPPTRSTCGACRKPPGRCYYSTSIFDRLPSDSVNPVNTSSIRQKSTKVCGKRPFFNIWKHYGSPDSNAYCERKVDSCHQKPLPFCCPRGRDTCCKEPIPECKPVEAPFPSFSDCYYDRFPKLKINECKQSDLNYRAQMSKIPDRTYPLPVPPKRRWGATRYKCWCPAPHTQQRREYSSYTRDPRDLLQYFESLKQQDHKRIDESELAQNIVTAIRVGLDSLKNSNRVDLSHPYFDFFKQLDRMCSVNLDGMITENIADATVGEEAASAQPKTVNILQKDNRAVIEAIQNFCRRVCDVHDFSVLEYEESEQKKTMDTVTMLNNLLENDK